MRTFSCFHPSVLFLPPLLAALSGCGVASSTSGAIGNASFDRGCAGSTLPCDTGSAVDAALAVGASFPLQVNVSLMGSGQPPIQLASTDTAVLTVSQQTVTGVAPGLATVLATSGGEVIDFVSLWVQLPVGIAISRLDGAGNDAGEILGPVGLLAGGTLDVSVSPVSPSLALSGSAPTTWSVSDPSVASVLDEGIFGRASVVARAAGTTTITASLLGFEKSFALEVTP
jgi:hypothetical protein